MPQPQSEFYYRVVGVDVENGREIPEALSEILPTLDEARTFAASVRETADPAYDRVEVQRRQRPVDRPPWEVVA